MIGGFRISVVLLGTDGRGDRRAATREELFVSYLSMMYITWDILDCVLITFLIFFHQFLYQHCPGHSFASCY